jgi:hypothetical protein
MDERQIELLREALDELNDAVLSAQNAQEALKLAGQHKMAERVEGEWCAMSEECSEVEDLLGIEWKDGAYQNVNTATKRE